MIRNYVENNGGGAIFTRKSREDPNYDEIVDAFPPKLRILFVNALADYVVSIFGSKPTYDKLEMVSKAAIILVPELKSKESEEGLASQDFCFLI